MPPQNRAPDKNLTRKNVALLIALAVDGMQWVLLPLVIGGAASPINDAMDVVVGAVMIWLVGWHWMFLPSFIAKLLPVVDMAPTWTLAVWLATRGSKPSEARIEP